MLCLTGMAEHSIYNLRRKDFECFFSDCTAAEGIREIKRKCRYRLHQKYNNSKSEIKPLLKMLKYNSPDMIYYSIRKQIGKGNIERYAWQHNLTLPFLKQFTGTER